MRIAIFGGGNGATAAAADLTEQGHEIAWWRRDAVAFKPVLDSGVLTLADFQGRREVRLALASTDVATVARGADLLLLPSPAFAQMDIAGALACHLTDGQVLFLPPGTFGSYAMAAAVHAAGNRAELAFAETGTLPYLTRKRGATEIAITIRAKRLPTGVFPAKHSDHAMRIIGAAYPAIEPVQDALSAALMNAGPIIHPPLILMNAGALQHFDKWDIHNEGTQAAVRAVTDRLDDERIAMREALGYAAPHFPLRDHYTSDRWMYGNAHDKLTESGDWRERIDLYSHRYMREDIVYGLGFLLSVADYAGVNAPLAAGLYALAAASIGEDFAATAPRTLQALGLAGLSREALAAHLRDGF